MIKMGLMPPDYYWSSKNMTVYYDFLKFIIKSEFTINLPNQII
jgi:hypothetical protein